jgi:amidohydrolase
MKRFNAIFLWHILGSLLLTLSSDLTVQAQTPDSLISEIDRLAQEVDAKVIELRRDFHQHPELGNREFRTSEIIAEYLTKLGLDVQTGVAHTGVVALLLGKSKEPLVALRADMDALPITEQTELSFASRVRTTEDGEEVGVMHACGHDAHMAILMGVATILTQIREKIPGSVRFIFQPAEEGQPAGEQGGAALMIKEGVLENPKPKAIFGLHVYPGAHVGTLRYRSKGAMASVDEMHIIVHGQQTHGAWPWTGIDPIVIASQIVLGLQTIISRQIPLVTAPAVLTIGSIHGGLRSNIIPEKVEMVGTIRSLDKDMRQVIHERIQRISTKIAESAGARVEVEIREVAPLVYNDPDLTGQMIPVLKRVAGMENIAEWPPMTGGEDFAYYQEHIPGFFFWLGITSPEIDPKSAPNLHSPNFIINEKGLQLGVRSLCNLAVEYLYLESGSEN